MKLKTDVNDDDDIIIDYGNNELDVTIQEQLEILAEILLSQILKDQ